VNVLEALDIVAGYGARRVLHGCDLRIDPGEFVTVVGPNGAGKSTLLRVLAGVLMPERGEVRLDGVDIRTLKRSELARRIAVVPQSLETLFPFTVREIVGLGRTARLDALGRASRDDHLAVERALTALDIAKLSERRIDLLSGGERQRVVLAMALAQEAGALLLDEPTVHLDPAHQLATLALLRQLARERGIAILAVMHELNLAALADRVVIVVSGRVVREGPPAAAIDQDVVAKIFGTGWRVSSHGGRPAVIPDVPSTTG
jgi:iron complex transport system ATP-binding protein